LNHDSEVYVYNKTRDCFVATEVSAADTYVRRLVGLLGKTGSWNRPGRGLWIIPCHGVHTLGMMFTIDLIFLDRDKRVVHVEEHVRPFRISKVCLNARSVLELPTHTVDRTGTRIGDQLEIVRHDRKPAVPPPAQRPASVAP
jgi:uncharacterized membrane protein (UPF0127 family)